MSRDLNGTFSPFIPQRWRDSTPLCPAGHLPLKGGDWLSFRLSTISSVAERSEASKLLISPLFGPETSRTGVRGHREQFCHLSSAEVEVDCFYF
ncbi:hypothetical protein, partial [Mesorhizobium sp. M0011]|uniref:hypothetical protein n=1 Tax=Mesorhizobium sp. M0011 TaxID=2956839 RepID=UPI003338EDBE